MILLVRVKILDKFHQQLLRHKGLELDVFVDTRVSSLKVALSALFTRVLAGSDDLVATKVGCARVVNELRNNIVTILLLQLIKVSLYINGLRSNCT